LSLSFNLLEIPVLTGIFLFSYFSPFYSNKPQGQGIGLMLVREILRNHDFSFNLHTRPDGWTEFRIGW
jgi:nitrogen-specific signal transduction histidine kinase